MMSMGHWLCAIGVEMKIVLDHFVLQLHLMMMGVVEGADRGFSNQLCWINWRNNNPSTRFYAGCRSD